ncbi:hypothetical protein ACJX0J_022112, partial [Zea mays]
MIFLQLFMIILGAIWIPSDFENPDKKNPNSFIGFRDPKNPLVKIHCLAFLSYAQS